MSRALDVFLVLFLMSACSKIENNINKVEFDCGEEGNFGQFRYAKLFGNEGVINNPASLLVSTELGDAMQGVLTPKGCLKLPKDTSTKVIVVNKDSSAGLAFYPDRVLSQGIVPLRLVQHQYGSLESSCKTDIATNASRIKWPFDFSSVHSESYRWSLQIKREGQTLANMQRAAFAELSKDEIDIAALPDGTYTLSILASELYSTANKPFRFECNLLIDRESPVVAIDRELVRLDDEQLAIRAAPGEAIKIRTAGAGTIDRLYACLLPRDRGEETCRYDQISGGFVTAPQNGNWVLKVYASDSANNQGPVTERNLQIYDSNLVDTVKAFIEEAVVAQKSGAGLLSMIAGVKAYEKMKNLTSSSEVSAVASGVRRALSESTLLPVEEMFVKSRQGSDVTGLGLMLKDKEMLYLQKGLDSSLDLYALNGEFKEKIDLAKVYGSLSPNSIGSIYCESKALVVTYAKNKIAFYVNGKFEKQIVLDDNDNLSVSSQVTDSCEQAMLSTGSKQILIDINAREAKTLAQSISGTLVGILEGDTKKLIVSLPNNSYQVFEFDNPNGQPLSEALGIPDAVQFKTMLDGRIGVLTVDKTLHVFDRTGRALFSFPNVTYFSSGLGSHEMLIVQYDYSLQVVSTVDGSSKSRLSISGSNWVYLTATEDFVIGLSAGANVVKIWTRTGNPLDEIYNKGDAIRKIWVSPAGYLYVSSNLYHKIYKLINPLTSKQVPRYWNALGLQFSSDGKKLLYKEQQPEFVDMQYLASNNLISWDLELNQRATFQLPNIAPSSKAYPGFGSQTRDLEYITQDGRDFVAATTKRGSIAVYRADDLGRAIETYDLTSNWLLDLAVDPSGNTIAAASMNGLIFVVGRKNGGWGAFSLNDVYSQYSEEYPVTMQFDGTGKYLYVTALKRNQFNVAVVFNAETQEYSLSLQNKVSGAGVNLAVHGETLAVVGNGQSLKIYDSELSLLRAYELSGSPNNMGQSVAFSPDGKKIYAGVYDGTWNELDVKSGKLLKVRFSSGESGATNLVVAPAGDRIAFMGGGFVQIVDLDVDHAYQKICTWLKPRLPYIPDLSEEDRSVCAKL